jgi:hypothetical protein
MYDGFPMLPLLILNRNWALAVVAIIPNSMMMIDFFICVISTYIYGF